MAEILDFVVNPQSALKALSDINSAITTNEGKFTGANKNIEASFKQVQDTLFKLTDRSYQANERYVQSLERQAAAINRTPIDKLIQQRDKLIQKLGSEEQQVNRVKAAYDKLIAAEAGGGGNKFQAFGEGIKNFIENPMRAGGTAATGLLKKMGPLGLGLAGVGGAAIALGTGLFEITKNAAESAEELTNLAASSGININQLDRLQAMAKLTGTDISSLARAGSAVAVALEDGGNKGKKLMDALDKVHVSAFNFNGTLKEEGELLPEILQALSGVTDQNERMSAAADIMGAKVSKNLQRLTLDYKHLDETASSMGFGNREEFLKQADDAAQSMHAFGLEVDIVEGKVANLTIGLAKAVHESAFFQFMFPSDHTEPNQAPPSPTPEADARLRAKYMAQDAARNAANARIASRYSGGDSNDVATQRIKEIEGDPKRQQDLTLINNKGAGVDTSAVQAAKDRLESQDREIASLKNQKELTTELKSLRKSLHEQELAAGIAELSGLDKINKKWDDQITKLKEAGDRGKQFAHDVADINVARGKDIALELQNMSARMEKENDQHNQAIGNARQGVTDNEARQMLQIQQQGQPKVQLHELGQPGVTTTSLTADIDKDFAQKKSNLDAFHKQELDIIENIEDVTAQGNAKWKENADYRVSSAKLELDKRNELATLAEKQHELDIKYQQDMMKLVSESQADAVKHQSSFGIRAAEIGGKEDPKQTIRDVFTIQIQEAQELTAIELHRISVEETGQQAALDSAKALRALNNEINSAQEEAILKQMELQQKQHDEIAKTASGLYHTLFTNPSKFGGELQSTIKEAALKPVTEKLGDMTASVFQGTGLFGGKKMDPVQSTNSNTVATNRNTEVIEALNKFLTMPSARPGSGSTEAASAAGPGFHIGSFGFSLPTTSARSSSIPFSFGGGGGSPNVGFPFSFGGGRGSSSGGGFRLGSASLGGTTPSVDTAVSFGDEYTGDTSGFSGAAVSRDYAGDTTGFSGPGAASTASTGGFSLLPSNGGGGFLGGFGESIATPTFVSGGIIPGVGSGGYSGGYSAPGGSGSSNSGFNLGGLFKTLGIGGQSQQGGAGSSGSSSSSKSGLGGLLGSLKGGTNWGGFTRSDPGGTPGPDDNTPGTDDSSDGQGGGGSITGVNGMAGQALGVGGMYLAQRGLLGNDRGTGKGVIEGTAGGAAIGMEYGGPIGAAVGAAIGLGIGLGEMAAGVESPLNKVKRLAKERYGVTVSTALANNLVQLAAQKYANNITIMMASPEVRQMLQLYAAGTGQKMPMSATTPHGGSLVEQGGQLEQQATYQYGQAYTFQSSLPVAGGIPTQSYGNYPGSSNQPMSLSINVGGKGAGDFLAGSVVTPDFVQAQWSNAQQGSNGRLDNSALIQQPGLIVT